MNYSRGQPEVMLLSKVILEMGRKSFAKVRDVVAQRIGEVRLARATGGTWDKAELVSLTLVSQPSSTALSDGAVAL